MRKQSTLENRVWTYESYRIPIKIYREQRINMRSTIGKTAAILRIPKGLNQQAEVKAFEWFETWLQEQISIQKRLQQRFLIKTYKNGDTITIQKKTFTLYFTESELKAHKAKLVGLNIHLYINKMDREIHLQKSIKQLLSRIIAQFFQKDIERRVDEINDLHFQKEINAIRLKYNQSNWGSCSSNKNINLSTRLLFAPSEVIDYVIIHELAHLKEMNHSPRFWKIIHDIMPNYKKQEQWLKEYGYLCDF